MSNDLKIASPWSQLALFLGLFGGCVILSGIAVLAIPGFHANGSNSPGIAKLAQTLGSIVQFGVPALFFAQLVFRGRPLFYLGFRPAVRNSLYVVAIALLLTSYPLVGWLGLVNKQIPLPHGAVVLEQEINRQIEMMLQGKTMTDLFINLVVMAILPAIVEEMCFRGVLQRILIGLCRNAWAGILVASIFFSLLHFELQGFLPRVFLGILLGAAYWYSGSLWPCILAHAFFNGIQVFLAMEYPQTVSGNPSLPLLAVLISAILVVSLLVYMRKQSGLALAGQNI
jgi:membrane protease YdiL (CAAX protease family)